MLDSDLDGHGDWSYVTDSVNIHVNNNNPPNTPDKPDGPITGFTGVSYTYSTSTTDPDDDDIRYGWDWNGDNVADEWSSSWKPSGNTDFQSNIWNQEGTYDLKVCAKDRDGAQSGWSEELTVTIIEIDEPDLDCFGVLNWSNVKPGSVINGSFSVMNMGDSGSLLDWKVESYPSWGNWTFTPFSGDDLTPEDGNITVEVSVLAPDINDSKFSGEIMVMNVENSSDIEKISVSLSTPKNKSFNNFDTWINLLIERFPILQPYFSN
jgi:hypothetical protein